MRVERISGSEGRASAETIVSGELDMSCLAAPTVPGQARTLIELRLGEWGLPGIADEVCLIAGELTTNAVMHAPEGEIRVRLTRERGAVLLGVWDSSDEMPVSRPVVELSLVDIAPDPEALEPGHDDRAGGWGLPIVAALAHQCGVDRTFPHGKWTWARVTC
jgi:anti-sigma regulatory factor (Ser/Thr protein kinase)